MDREKFLNLAIAESRRHITGQLLTLMRFGALDREDAKNIEEVINTYVRKPKVAHLSAKERKCQ